MYYLIHLQEDKTHIVVSFPEKLWTFADLNSIYKDSYREDTCDANTIDVWLHKVPGNPLVICTHSSPITTKFLQKHHPELFI